MQVIKRPPGAAPSLGASECSQTCPLEEYASPSCSLDALERVVHFTGAGADACFYRVRPAETAAVAALRYWLNPSVQTRQTTATCEILNLGAPHFSATSQADLRLSVTPYFPNGRCFPTRCVVSLATSAQRLDEVALRPVVVSEWSLTPSSTLSHTSPNAEVERRAYSTTVPLRTLYHLAVLLGNSSAVEDGVTGVRLYLQLRFTGCSDDSDTHRIAAVRLRYEHLGAASEILSQLKQLRSKCCGEQVTSPCSTRIDSGMDKGTAVRAATLLEERVVNLDSIIFEKDEFNNSRPQTPLPSRAKTSTRKGSITEEEEEAQDALPQRSPPQRSTTRPRPERSRSAVREANSEKSSARENGSFCGTTLFRIERTLRLPPPPQGISMAPDSFEPSPLLEGPRTPRKMRSMVLAPSISVSLSPSFSNTSSSRGSSPPLPQPSILWPAESSAARAATEAVSSTGPLPVSRSGSQRNRTNFSSDAISAASPGGAPQTDSPNHLHQSASPSPTNAITATSSTSPVCQSSPSVLASEEAVRGARLDQAGPSHQRASSDTAVLWAAASLLGASPRTLCGGQRSGRNTPAPSASTSRASSSASARDTSWRSQQPPPPVARSSLSPCSSAFGNDTKQPVPRGSPLGLLDSNRSPPASAVTSAAGWRCGKDPAVSWPFHWRGENAHVDGHVPPQLRPPGRVSSTFSSPLAPSSSAFVPRLSLRKGSLSDGSHSTLGGHSRRRNDREPMAVAAARVGPSWSAQNGYGGSRTVVADATSLSSLFTSRGSKRVAAEAPAAEGRGDSLATSLPSAYAPTTLSVVPSSWLQQKSGVNPNAWDKSRQAERRMDPTPMAAAAALGNTLQGRAAASRTVDDDGAPIPTLPQPGNDEIQPPPPSAPPSHPRALFHNPKPTQSLRSTSSSTSRSSDREAAPALPLQEASQRHRYARRRKQDGGDVRAKEGGGKDISGRGPKEERCFAVWKHHSSRRGTGRRLLRVSKGVAPLSPHFRIALQKLRSNTLPSFFAGTRGLHTKDGELAGHGERSACEVSVSAGEALEVWTGVRAYHSGVIHQDKVHHVECCVVIWCNSQLITAVEVESVAAVEQLRQMLTSP